MEGAIVTAEDFIRAELEKSGRTSYTLEEVERLVQQYREAKAAAAKDWTAASVNELIGVEVRK